MSATFLQQCGHTLGNATTTSWPPSSAKIRLTIALRLCPTSRETTVLPWLLKAEKTSKLASSTWQSSAQVKWVSCTAATFTQRCESSPCKRAHLLESPSPLTTYQFSVDDGPDWLYCPYPSTTTFHECGCWMKVITMDALL